jgi:hypothetical protein
VSQRELEFVLRKRGVVAVAELLEDFAPRTCAAVWKLAPIQGVPYHAAYSGREIGLVIESPVQPIPPENRTIAPQSGDVLLEVFAAGVRGNPEPRTIVALFYGRDSVPRQLDGPSPCNLFARLGRARREFARACEELWREGLGTLLIRRRE